MPPGATVAWDTCFTISMSGADGICTVLVTLSSSCTVCPFRSSLVPVAVASLTNCAPLGTVDITCTVNSIVTLALGANVPAKVKLRVRLPAPLNPPVAPVGRPVAVKAGFCNVAGSWSVTTTLFNGTLPVLVTTNV